MKQRQAMTNTRTYLATAIVLVLHYANASPDPQPDQPDQPDQPYLPYQPSGRVETFHRGDERWTVEGDDEQIEMVTCKEYVCPECTRQTRWMCTEHMRFPDYNVYKTNVSCVKSLFMIETCSAETVVSGVFYCIYSTLSIIVCLALVWVLVEYCMWLVGNKTQ